MDRETEEEEAEERAKADRRLAFLSPKQRAFIEHYGQTHDAYTSAKAAGFSERQARIQAYRYLRNPTVRGEIGRLSEASVQADAVSTDRVMAEAAKVAFADISNFVDPKGNILNVGAMHNRETAAIKEITNTYEGGKRTSHTIKLHDKMRALKELGRYVPKERWRQVANAVLNKEDARERIVGALLQSLQSPDSSERLKAASELSHIYGLRKTPEIGELEDRIKRIEEGPRPIDVESTESTSTG